MRVFAGGSPKRSELCFSMKEEFESEKRRLQEELDDLRVQLALGKADAADYMEEKKKEFSHFVEQTRNSLQHSGEPVSDKLATVRGKLDELKLQLALGRMESADVYEEQKEKIGAAIREARHHLADLGDSSHEEWKHIRESFDDRADAFATKLEGAALNVGAGALLAADETKSLLQSISEKIQNAASMTKEEAKEARNYVRERIRLHRQ